jgi:transcriptional regulator with XRE-family HTH domain
MPATPRRAGREAPKGSRYPSEIVADNIRDHRSLRRVSQQQLADEMSRLGHGWWRATVSEVERAGRAVTVDELVALALALGVTVADLLDPAGPAGTRDAGMYVGEVAYPEGARYLIPGLAQIVARSAAPVEFRAEDRSLSVPLTADTLPYTGRPGWRMVKEEER